MIVRLDEPLSRHTAWRTGGRCGAYAVVQSVEELAEVTQDCRAADWKLLLLGHGTRSVFRDADLPRVVVVRLGGALGTIEADGLRWRVGAAVPLPALLAFAAAAGCAGLEDLTPVPGSVGASAALDAAWGGRLTSVEVLHRGRAVVMGIEEARANKKTVLAVELALTADEPASIRRRMERTLAATTRGKTATPVSSWYAPPGRQTLREVFASVLLPRVRLRDVAIPANAPELLINLGGGTASDLALLQKSALERVKSTRGLELDSRVLWAGAAP